jgi:hypothetical protein
MKGMPYLVTAMTGDYVKKQKQAVYAEIRRLPVGKTADGAQ